MGVRALKTPVRTPVANALCERFIDTMRRECLDFVIPLNERHLYHILKEWITHYNEGRPHMSLGLGIPASPGTGGFTPRSPAPVPTTHRVTARPILRGLHHEYALENTAARAHPSR